MEETCGLMSLFGWLELVGAPTLCNQWLILWLASKFEDGVRLLSLEGLMESLFQSRALNTMGLIVQVMRMEAMGMLMPKTRT